MSSANSADSPRTPASSYPVTDGSLAHRVNPSPNTNAAPATVSGTTGACPTYTTNAPCGTSCSTRTSGSLLSSPAWPFFVGSPDRLSLWSHIDGRRTRRHDSRKRSRTGAGRWQHQLRKTTPWSPDWGPPQLFFCERFVTAAASSGDRRWQRRLRSGSAALGRFGIGGGSDSLLCAARIESGTSRSGAAFITRVAAR